MSLPNRTLSFGFGFFILIIVSVRSLILRDKIHLFILILVIPSLQAYVANLAAFLTMDTANNMSTMKQAIAAGYTICAHPAVKSGGQHTL